MIVRVFIPTLPSQIWIQTFSVFGRDFCSAHNNNNNNNNSKLNENRTFFVCRNPPWHIVTCLFDVERKRIFISLNFPPPSFFLLVALTVSILYAETLVGFQTTASRPKPTSSSILLVVLCFVLATLTIATKCCASNALVTPLQQPQKDVKSSLLENNIPRLRPHYYGSSKTIITAGKIRTRRKKSSEVFRSGAIIPSSDRSSYHLFLLGHPRGGVVGRRVAKRSTDHEDSVRYGNAESETVDYSVFEDKEKKKKKGLLKDEDGDDPDSSSYGFVVNNNNNTFISNNSNANNYSEVIATDDNSGGDARESNESGDSSQNKSLLFDHRGAVRTRDRYKWRSSETGPKGDGEQPMPPTHEDSSSLSHQSTVLLLVVSSIVLTVALTLVTCVLSHYRGGTAADPHDARQTPTTAPMLSVVSAGAATGVGGMADRLRGHHHGHHHHHHHHHLHHGGVGSGGGGRGGGAAGGGGTTTTMTSSSTRDLVAASSRDRQVRLQAVNTDFTINLPPSIALPDGEDHPYSNARLHIRDSDQESEIYQKCIKPPPNRTVLESESPPPYRSSSAGLLGSTSSSSGSNSSSSSTSSSSDWSGGNAPLVVRCHSMSSSSSTSTKRPSDIATAAAVAPLTANVVTCSSSASASGGSTSQKTDFLQRTVKIFTGGSKKSQPPPAPTLLLPPVVIVPTRSRNLTSEHHHHHHQQQQQQQQQQQNSPRPKPPGI